MMLVKKTGDSTLVSTPTRNTGEHAMLLTPDYGCGVAIALVAAA